MTLRLVPVNRDVACRYVAAWHRHNRPPVGYKFAIGAADDDDVLRAVVVVSRPVARHYDDGLTLEVIRTTTDGARNANSLLYGAAARATFALGYRRLITYTRADESGASLRGAGWHVIAQRRPRTNWSRPSRPRGEHGEAHIPRTLWEAVP